ncbi:MAG: hypothetical protein OCC49_09050 [Fibrobacterales bacterium]
MVFDNSLIWVGIIAIAIALVTTWYSMRLAHRFGVIDTPGGRRIHVRIVPRMGGAGIVTAFYLTLVIIDVLFNTIDWHAYWPILLGGIVIWLLGLVDDIRSLSPKIKLLVQALVAGFVISQGTTIEWVKIPFFNVTLHLGYLGYGITFIWIIGVCNAINLIDGLDGLVAGLSIIILATISFFVFMYQGGDLLPITVALSGALVGFLKFNFHPAKTFMGDSGSLFLGYMIAVATIQGTMLDSAAVTLLIPITILGIPLLDTTLAIVRRKAVKKKVMEADAEHLHHVLLRQGLSHPQTVMVLYGMSFIFSVVSVLLVTADRKGTAAILLLLMMTIYLLISKLGYIRKIVSTRHYQAKRARRSTYRHEAGEGVVVNSFQSTVIRFIKGTPMLMLLDVTFLLTAYIFARWIQADGKLIFESDIESVIHFGFIAAVYFLFMYTRKSYNIIWRYIKLSDLNRLFRTLILVLGVVYFLDGFIVPEFELGEQFYMLFLLLIIPSISATRLLHRYYYSFVKRVVSGRKKGENIFIFGAGDTGDLLQHFITHSEGIPFKIVGFIDDNSAKLDKSIDRYPVLGSVEDLPHLMLTHKVKRLFLSTPLINRETKKLLLEYNQTLGLKVHVFRMKLMTADLEGLD